LVAAAAWLWRRHGVVGRLGAVAILVAQLVISVLGSVAAVAELKNGPSGYASFKWYDSKAMAQLRTLSAGVKIFTNEPGAVYLYTDRGAYVLPGMYDPVTASPQDGFEVGVRIMQEEILAGQAVLALFDEADLLPEESEALTTGLFLIHKSGGDEIYAGGPEQELR